MAFDQAELQAVEARYLEDRSRGLAELYTALVPCAETILRAYAKKIGLRLTRSRIRQVSHDATTRLLEMYIKRPGWRSTALSSRMYLEVVFQLHNRGQRKEDETVELPITMAAPCVRDVCEADIRGYVQMIGGDDEVDGRRVVIELYRARYYKRAVLSIAEYTSKDWVYAHAVELRTIFLNTRPM